LAASQQIGDTSHYDGGIMYSSPILALSDEIARNCTKKRLRLFYISSYQMDEPLTRAGFKGFVSRARSLFSQSMHTDNLIDRIAAVDVLRKICDDPYNTIHYENIHNANHELLTELLDKLSKKTHYVVIMYPHGAHGVSLLKFTTQDLIDGVKRIWKGSSEKPTYGLDVWYCD
jgi:hypothetical protein